MPKFIVASPDGKKYEVNAPEGSTQEQAIEYVKNNIKPQAAELQPSQPSFYDELKRGAGLAARNIVEGAVALPAMVADVPAAASNLLFGTKFPAQQKAVSELLTRAGLPEPSNDFEKTVGNVTQAAAGLGGSIAAGAKMAQSVAAPVAKAVGEALAAKPAAQLLATTGAVLGGEAAQKSGLGVGGEIAGSIVGSLLPAAAPIAGRSIIKYSPEIYKGIFARDKKATVTAAESLSNLLDNKEQVIGQIRDYLKNSDLPLSVGQITQNPKVLAEETAYGKKIGSQISNLRDFQKTSASEKISNIANGSNVFELGQNAKRQQLLILSRLKEKTKNAYDTVESLIPDTTATPLANTKKLFNDIAFQRMAGGPQTREPILNSLQEKFTDTMALGDIKAVRSEIRDEAEKAARAGNKQLAGMYKLLNKSLTEDYEAPFAAIGSDALTKARKASAFENQTDKVLNRLLGKIEKDYDTSAQAGQKFLQSVSKNRQNPAAFVRFWDLSSPKAQDDMVKAYWGTFIEENGKLNVAKFKKAVQGMPEPMKVRLLPKGNQQSKAIISVADALQKIDDAFARGRMPGSPTAQTQFASNSLNQLRQKYSGTVLGNLVTDFADYVSTHKQANDILETALANPEFALELLAKPTPQRIKVVGDTLKGISARTGVATAVSVPVLTE